MLTGSKPAAALAAASKANTPQTSSPQADNHNTEEKTETTDSEDKGSVSKVSLLQQENQASPKNRQVEQRVKLNNLQLRTADTEARQEVAIDRTGFKTGETANITCDSEPTEASGTQERLRKNPNLDSSSWPGTEGKVLLNLKESLKTEGKGLFQQATGSECKMVKRLTASEIMKSNSGSNAEEQQQLLEFNSVSKSEDSVESDPRRREEKKREEERTTSEEEKEEQKTRGAKKQLLR